MSEKSCPLGWHCDKCLWHTKLRGINPQTGTELDSEGCAIAFLPILLIENSQQQRQTAAAVESTRNEVIRSLSGAASVIASSLEDMRPTSVGYTVLEARHEPN
jgi:hypothetical protein